ncbi:hypothetical protein ABIA31_006398 [Catenulispora sp. MAP5-51]|uniref:hypothetical protein n=1 Tax=Catenulispora sp. MAP5-51 TaxID=3156298 RepID=UPI0035197688
MNQPEPQWPQQNEQQQYPAQPVNPYGSGKKAHAPQHQQQQPYAAPQGWQQPQQAYPPAQQYQAPNPGWQQAGGAPQYPAGQGWQQPQASPAAPGWQQPADAPQPHAAPAWQQQPAAPAAAPAWQQPAEAHPAPAWQQPSAPAGAPAWQQPANVAPQVAPAAPAWQQQPPAPAAPPAWQQPPAAAPQAAPPAPAWQQPAPAQQYPAPPAAANQPWQQPVPYQASPAAPNQGWQQQQQPQPQSASFPPPPGLATPRDRLVEGAAPFLEPGETVYYGFILKLDDTIPETPRELMIAIEGQHRVLGGISRADKKMNKGLKWALNPMDAMNERIAEKSVEALNRKLAGPVFLGGWESQAGWFIRYSRATREDYGPGSWGVLTDRRYLIFRAGRTGGSSMRLVHAVPRTGIAGVRTEGTKDAALHGRTPRAELHFADGSMVATMMPTKQAQKVAEILAVQQQHQQPQQHQNQNQQGY